MRSHAITVIASLHAEKEKALLVEDDKPLTPEAKPSVMAVLASLGRALVVVQDTKKKMGKAI